MVSQVWHRRRGQRSSGKHSALYSQIPEIRGMPRHAGLHGKAPECQDAEDRSKGESGPEPLLGVSEGKAKLCAGNGSRLASLNNFGGL